MSLPDWTPKCMLKDPLEENLRPSVEVPRQSEKTLTERVQSESANPVRTELPDREAESSVVGGWGCLAKNIICQPSLKWTFLRKYQTEFIIKSKIEIFFPTPFAVWGCLFRSVSCMRPVRTAGVYLVLHSLLGPFFGITFGRPLYPVCTLLGASTAGAPRHRNLLA